MNDKQLGALGRHAFRLNDTGNAIAKAANPQLADTFGMVRRIVDNLPPPGNYMRELQWKGAHPAVKSLMMQYNDDLAKKMANGLAEMQAIDEETAYKQLTNMNLSPTSAPGGINTAASIPELKVNDVKLKDWFTKGDSGLSKWAKQNFDVVNKTVQRGIFEGLDTDTIASQIIQESRLAGFKGAKIAGDTAAARVYRQAQTLARTAVAEQNHQINERVWDANKEAMEGVQYEWVAALDSKTCEICAPMDGRVTDTRDEQEQWPIHFNCRCQVVPFDPNGPDEINVQEVSKDPFTYKGKTLDEMTKAEREEALTKGGLYASKVKVNGEMMYRKTRTISVGKGKNRYAQYMAKANKETQNEFFGSKARADLFRREVERGADPQETLARMLKGPRDDKTWRPVDSPLAALRKRQPAPKPTPKPAPVVKRKGAPKPAAKAAAPAPKAAPKPAPKKTVAPPKQEIRQWTANGYKEMRAEEFRQAQAAGVKLSKYEKDQIKAFPRNDRTVKATKAVEAYVESDAARYKGTVYRGMNLEKAELDDLLKRYESGGPALAMESWTKNPDLSDFTIGGGNPVKLRIVNKHGVDIERFSGIKEEREVLMPKNVRYRVKNVERTEFSASATKRGIYNYDIELEQLDD